MLQLVISFMAVYVGCITGTGGRIGVASVYKEVDVEFPTGLGGVIG